MSNSLWSFAAVRHRVALFAIVSLVGCAAAFFGADIARAATREQDLATAMSLVQRATQAASEGDIEAAKRAYDQYENAWFEIEDGVRAQSRESYVSIEKAMNAVSTTFAAQPADRDQVVSSLAALDREQRAFLEGVPAAASPPPAPAPGPSSVTGLLGLLSEAQAAIEKNDYTTAAARLKAFESTWLEVEGEIKTRSSDAYRQTENDMALASTLANQRSPETSQVVSRMATRLEPYQEARRYGIFDAAIILLREGLEALLVIVALSAFLKKSDNRAGQGWLWSGAVGGLIVSVLLGLAIQAFFGAVINPTNRELVEGVIGLVAAGMLVYVSYWLHSKASLGGWQSYISNRTQHAIQGGRLVGLAVLAFLAVFREGAETSLFYLGMVSNISNGDLLIGLGLGALSLAVLGLLMVVVGLRIPMRPFFTVASLLVFYLCFKFVGTGIHALQVAGLIPSGSAGYLPTLDAIGLYPTWPTTLAQAILLLAGLWVVLRDRLRPALGVGAVLLSSMACAPAAPAAPTVPPTAAVAVAPAPALTSGADMTRTTPGSEDVRSAAGLGAMHTALGSKH